MQRSAQLHRHALPGDGDLAELVRVARLGRRVLGRALATSARAPGHVRPWMWRVVGDLAATLSVRTFGPWYFRRFRLRAARCLMPAPPQLFCTFAFGEWNAVGWPGLEGRGDDPHPSQNHPEAVQLEVANPAGCTDVLPTDRVPGRTRFMRPDVAAIRARVRAGKGDPVWMPRAVWAMTGLGGRDSSRDRFWVAVTGFGKP